MKKLIVSFALMVITLASYAQVYKMYRDKKKTDARRRCALHPEKSNKDLLNKAFYHVSLISITIIIVTIVKS